MKNNREFSKKTHAVNLKESSIVHYYKMNALQIALNPSGRLCILGIMVIVFFYQILAGSKIGYGSVLGLILVHMSWVFVSCFRKSKRTYIAAKNDDMICCGDEITSDWIPLGSINKVKVGVFGICVIEQKTGHKFLAPEEFCREAHLLK